MKNFFQEKKVLVAGGLGFLGSNLSLKLASLGAIVTATTRNLSKNKRLSETELKKINIKEVDLLNFEQCLNACKGQDIVINCAFSGSKPSQEKGDATIFR
ncbi:MAG: NAD-dependent epimerase/dehydratase family protein, partial [Candidatus Diapherotrites archaeon]